MDINTLWDFIMNATYAVSNFGKWLITPLEYINLPPLALFSVFGITIIIGVHLVRLFVG